MLNDIMARVNSWDMKTDMYSEECFECLESFRSGDVGKYDSPSPITRFWALVWMYRIRDMINVMKCGLYGHEFAETTYDVENGSENVFCDRCGFECGGYFD